MSYQDRAEAEAATGHPAFPCPYCGYDSWTVHRPYRKSRHDRPCLFAAVCSHCSIMETAHHVDGEWMGMRRYSKFPGSLYDFVTGYAAYLRETR